MRERNFRKGVGAVAMVAATALLLGSWGCGGLEEQGLPDLTGPSDAGVSVDLTAAPDTVNADGVSTSLVRLVVRDNEGRALSGKPVLFWFNGDGWLTPAAGSLYVGPVQTGFVMVTDQNGVADVVYTAGWGARTVSVQVRPYGVDSSFYFFRSVEILQL